MTTSEHSERGQPLAVPLSDQLGEAPARDNEGKPQDHVDLRAVAELDAVAAMLKRAEVAGLMVEVVASFGNYRNGGNDAAEAARCALWDWDA